VLGDKTRNGEYKFWFLGSKIAKLANQWTLGNAGIGVKFFLRPCCYWVYGEKRKIVKIPFFWHFGGFFSDFLKKAGVFWPVFAFF